MIQKKKKAPSSKSWNCIGLTEFSWHHFLLCVVVKGVRKSGFMFTSGTGSTKCHSVLKDTLWVCRNIGDFWKKGTIGLLFQIKVPLKIWGVCISVLFCSIIEQNESNLKFKFRVQLLLQHFLLERLFMCCLNVNMHRGFEYFKSA